MNQLMKCRKRRNEVKTREKSLLWDRVLGGAYRDRNLAAQSGLRHRDGRNLSEAGVWNVGTQLWRCEERSHKLKNSEGESIKAQVGGGAIRSSDDRLGNLAVAKGLPLSPESNWPTSIAGRSET